MSDETPETVEAKYRLVVTHQLSVEQMCSLEVVTLDRERATADAAVFIKLFTDQHEIARQRAFGEAEKKRDMLFQKIGNLQEEIVRLDAMRAELEGRRYVQRNGEKITVAEALKRHDQGKTDGDPQR